MGRQCKDCQHRVRPTCMVTAKPVPKKESLSHVRSQGEKMREYEVKHQPYGDPSYSTWCVYLQFNEDIIMDNIPDEDTAYKICESLNAAYRRGFSQGALLIWRT